MSPGALANFIDYETPTFDFSVGNSLYNFQPVVQQPYVAPPVYTAPQIVLPTYAPIAVPVTATKTISFTVSDDVGTIDGANIYVDGIQRTKSDINGKVTLVNVASNSTIKVSYVSKIPFISVASSIPNNVFLVQNTEQLDEAVAEKKSPKPTSNTWLWWLAGAVGAFGIYKYSKTGTKVVQAKI